MYVYLNRHFIKNQSSFSTLQVQSICLFPHPLKDVLLEARFLLYRVLIILEQPAAREYQETTVPKILVSTWTSSPQHQAQSDYSETTGMCIVNILVDTPLPNFLFQIYEKGFASLVRGLSLGAIPYFCCHDHTLFFSVCGACLLVMG